MQLNEVAELTCTGYFTTRLCYFETNTTLVTMHMEVVDFLLGVS
jgi:hypothetical protein